MKNLRNFLIIAGVGATALFIPAKSTKAWNDGPGSPPSMILECYHSRDGVLDESPYIILQNTNTCPPCGSVAACVNSPNHNNKSLPGVPPYLCQEVGFGE